MKTNCFIIILVVIVVLVILAIVPAFMSGRSGEQSVEIGGNDGGKEKYILYYSNGGLIHNLGMIQSHIDFAKKYNRTLLIYSKFENEFQIDFDDIFYIDDPELKYKTDKDFCSLNDELLINSEIPFNNYKDIEANWNIVDGKMAFRYKDKNFLGINHEDVKSDIVIYKHNVNILTSKTNIKIQPTILQKIHSKTINTPYIGVHYRNTDYKNDINNILKQIHKQLEKHKYINTLFLATDDNSSVDRFRKLVQR